MKKEKILQLLQKKRGFFEAILDLTRNEQHLSTTQWINSLEEKKVILACIEEIDGQLDSCKPTIEKISAEISEEVDCICQLIQDILDVDLQNQHYRKSANPVFASLWTKRT